MLRRHFSIASLSGLMCHLYYPFAVRKSTVTSWWGLHQGPLSVASISADHTVSTGGRLTSREPRAANFRLWNFKDKGKAESAKMSRVRPADAGFLHPGTRPWCQWTRCWWRTQLFHADPIIECRLYPSARVVRLDDHGSGTGRSD